MMSTTPGPMNGHQKYLRKIRRISNGRLSISSEKSAVSVAPPSCVRRTWERSCSSESGMSFFRRLKWLEKEIHSGLDFERRASLLCSYLLSTDHKIKILRINTHHHLPTLSPVYDSRYTTSESPPQYPAESHLETEISNHHPYHGRL